MEREEGARAEAPRRDRILCYINMQSPGNGLSPTRSCWSQDQPVLMFHPR